MSLRQNPPFRAEHIGSLLRPKDLTQAFKKFNAGEMSEEEFSAAQDAAIRDVVAAQEAAGLRLVTDGEFRRASYWGHWVDAIDGLGVKEALFKFHDETGAEMVFIAANGTGRLKKAHPISTEEFKFIKSVVGSAEPKITMPSPSTLHFWRLSETIEDTPYETDEEFMADLSAIFAQEIADLAALGCTYVQLDEVPLIMLGNPNIRAKVEELGGDPDALISLYIKGMNDAVKDRPDGMVAAMHICRGNFKGRWLTEGGYDEIAERVFREVDVDAFCLEYDTERAGSFEPLRHVPSDKMVVLGLVSTKTPVIEDADRLIARIEDAARFIDKDHLCISPQCGFASTVAGNPVTPDAQEAKLKLLVDVANQVWGEA